MNDPFELLGVELSTKAMRDTFNAIKSHTNDGLGVICFSKRWSNPVLWAHYADKHRGICLGFDIPDSSVRAVSYTGTRLPITLRHVLEGPLSDSKFMVRLLLTKYKAWKYEDEVRVFCTLEKAATERSSDGPDMFFKSFHSELRLRKVILGPRCVIPKAKIVSLLGDLRDSVEVVQSRLAFKSFRVVENLAMRGKLE